MDWRVGLCLGVGVVQRLGIRADRVYSVAGTGAALGTGTNS